MVPGVFLMVVPKLPNLSGAGIEFVPNLSKCRVPVSSSYRTIPDCSAGHGGRTEPLL